MLFWQIFCCWKCWFPCQPVEHLRDALCAYLHKARVSFHWFSCLCIQLSLFGLCWLFFLFLWQIWNALFLRWPVRTIGFNYTGDLIASASEDLFIDIVSYMTFFLSFLFLASFLSSFFSLSFFIALTCFLYCAYLLSLLLRCFLVFCFLSRLLVSFLFCLLACFLSYFHIKKWILNLTNFIKSAYKVRFTPSYILWNVIDYIISSQCVIYNTPLTLRPINSCVRLYIYECSDNGWSDKSNKLFLLG